MHNGHLPFIEYLTATQPNNVADLVGKAKVASRLAKLARGTSQELLYRQKHTLLSQALVAHPSSFRLSWIELTGLIGLEFVPTGKRFHVPSSQLSDEARAIVAELLVQIIFPLAS